MNRGTIAVAVGAAVLLALGLFAFWPAGEPVDAGDPTAAGRDGRPDRVVTRFRNSSGGGGISGPAERLDIPLKQRPPTPLDSVRPEAVEVLGIELSQRIDRFLDRQVDPEIPPDADAMKLHTIYREDFRQITMEFGGLENALKVKERGIEGEDFRETRIARAAVRASLADKVEQVPPPPTLPLPQHPTYREKLYGRAEDIRDEARVLLDELLEDDPGAAAAVAELRAAIDDP